MITELHSLRGLAWFLHIPLHQLRELAALPEFRRYRPFKIHKGTKVREIDNPVEWLKGVQRAIRRRILSTQPVHASVRV